MYSHIHFAENQRQKGWSLRSYPLNRRAGPKPGVWARDWGRGGDSKRKSSHAH